MTKFMEPSREDAKHLTRNEKQSLTFLMNTVSSMAEVRDDLKDRIGMIDGGQELIDSLVENGLKLLSEISLTIPEKQRMNLVNTAKDYKMQMVPKLMQQRTCVLVQAEEFRQMIDAAQAKCIDCTELNEDCRKCKLFQLLSTVLPLDNYDGTFLCPYNMAEWGN